MDTTDIVRIAVTVAGFVSFLLILIWAYGKSTKARFEEAAQRMLDDDDNTVPTSKE
ncbi:cbb3-type cytochrome c oxidase subunit 3 [Burkholderiaceae bacterium DAT-1]|nr:cbb3-type cytochrome c oxidase subunit 3 [Burkholderiaceae bacterium DAT-1]